MSPTEASAHDLTRTINCKIDGCPHEAVDQAGPYARLCGGHREQAKARRAQPPPSPTGSRPASPGGRAAQAKLVLKLCRAADVARGRTRPAVLAAERAEREYRDALDALSRMTP